VLRHRIVLPYYEQPHLDLGPIPIHAFGVLVGIAVLGGIELAARRARSQSLDPSTVSAFALWILVPGFVGAHVFDVLWYHPHEVWREPSVLFDLLAGMSSFGGFVGAIVGAFAWRATTGDAILPYVDLVVSVFPISWAIGRAGCTVAHDHPGIRTSADNPLAFAYPDGPRWDLGFLEMLFAIVLAVVFVGLWRRPRALGTYVAIASLAYAPARFALDFLRADVGSGGDARYDGLTPAQWACIALAVLGLFALRSVMDERGRARRAVVAVATPSR
jgi:phosphatidylglycerol:prolipoprotein diacylglycerol transferase